VFNFAPAFDTAFFKCSPWFDSMGSNRLNSAGISMETVSTIGRTFTPAFKQCHDRPRFASGLSDPARSKRSLFARCKMMA
jgi:hypothetical protein